MLVNTNGVTRLFPHDGDTATIVMVVEDNLPYRVKVAAITDPAIMARDRSPHKREVNEAMASSSYQVMDVETVYRFLVEENNISPLEFFSAFFTMPRNEQNIFYPKEKADLVRKTLKDAYRLLSGHGLGYLLTTPMYFYNGTEGSGHHVRIPGRSFVIATLTSQPITRAVLLHELGHELYFTHFSDEMRQGIEEEYARHEKVLPPPPTGDIILYGADKEWDGEIFTVKGITEGNLDIEWQGNEGHCWQRLLRFANVLTKRDGRFVHLPFVSDSSFPTDYSMVDPSEWWAELFSAFILGQLTGEPAAFVEKQLKLMEK